MKLEATVAPRNDGTVKAKFGETNYVFADDGSGALVCDVTDEAAVSHLLNTQNFIPFDEADMDQATNLLKGGAGDDDDLGGDEDPDGDEEGDEIDLNAAPVEAHTPPAGLPKTSPKIKTSGKTKGK